MGERPYYPRLRDELRSLQPPFLLRHFDATPEDYEAITDEDLECEYIDAELIAELWTQPGEARDRRRG